jgi:hypothetical protein
MHGIYINIKLTCEIVIGMYLSIASLIAGLFLLEYGADKFVDHTAILARRLGVSQTLVALLTAGAEWEEVRLDPNHWPTY